MRHVGQRAKWSLESALGIRAISLFYILIILLSCLNIAPSINILMLTIKNSWKPEQDWSHCRPWGAEQIQGEFISEAALKNDAIKAADNALDFTAEFLCKRFHAPFSCDGFFLCTHNIKDQRRISMFFLAGDIPRNGFDGWSTQAWRNYRPTIGKKHQ